MNSVAKMKATVTKLSYKIEVQEIQEKGKLPGSCQVLGSVPGCQDLCDFIHNHAKI